MGTDLVAWFLRLLWWSRIRPNSCTLREGFANAHVCGRMLWTPRHHHASGVLLPRLNIPAFWHNLNIWTLTGSSWESLPQAETDLAPLTTSPLIDVVLVVLTAHHAAGGDELIHAKQVTILIILPSFLP